MKKTKPSVIFHLVGQSSVLASYKDPLDTVNANVNGTVNILEAARTCKSIKSIILITSDKVYLNLEEKENLKRQINWAVMIYIVLVKRQVMF